MLLRVGETIMGIKDEVARLISQDYIANMESCEEIADKIDKLYVLEGVEKYRECPNCMSCDYFGYDWDGIDDE